MVRCAVCGCRLSPHDPVCATHGPQPLPEEGGPPPPRPPLPVVEGYAVQKLLGQGGFGAVYKAQREADGLTVALKLALADNPAARKSLAQEIWALRTVPAPYAPEFIGEGTAADGSPYLALEFVSAPVLSDVMEQMPGHWTVDRVASVFNPLLEAMAAVHQAGIVHRDVKPENFFLAGSGTQVNVRVFDFGLSAPTGQAADPDSAREGTPEYMAPEQDAADLSMDPRADVYSLGVLLYEMLAGCLPFAGTAADMREGHRSRRPPVFARRVGVAQKVEAVVLQCLSKDRERRFENARALLVALREVWDAPLLATGEHMAMTSSLTRETLAMPSLTPGAPAAPAAPKAKAEQRPMGLLFFKPKEGQAVGPAEAKRLGGELASASPALGIVVAFDHESSDNPVRLAATAAQRALELGLCDRAIVDAFNVLMQVRPNGQRRFVSAAFTRKDRYLADTFEAGVYLTQAALDLVPQLEATSMPGTDLHQLLQAEQRELTSVGVVRHAFVGRDVELEQLFASATQTATNQVPTIATVIAEGGMGKSELASALAAGLTQKLPQADVCAFRCQEGLDGGQSRNVADLLRWALGLQRDVPDDKGRAVLSQHFGLPDGDPSWAAPALALNWVGLDEPDLKDLLSAPGALRAAIARATGEALRLAAKKRPIVVVADDAHLADETLLDGLEYATLKEAQAAVWVCVLTRPSLLMGRPLLGARAATNPTLNLAPLRNEDAILLARILLQPVENIPTAALQKLVSRTQGNPLMLVELVRSLKRDGAIKQSSKGEYRLEVEAIDQLPDSPVVQWLATREIEALPPDLAGHARMAAILGSDLSDIELEGVIVLAEEEGTPIETQLDANVGMRRLVDANILVRHRSGRFSFRYGVLRDATYSLVPEANRQIIHALAYRFYFAHSQAPDDEKLPRLAYHAARAGLRQEAAALFVRLGDNARQRHSYLDASNLYAQARTQIDPQDTERLLPVLLSHATMLLRVGQYDRALAGLTEAYAMAKQREDRNMQFEIALEMAAAADFLHYYEQSKERATEAESLLPDANNPLMRARVLMAKARSLYRFSDVEGSIPLYYESAQLAGPLGDVGYETRVDALTVLGAALGSLGRLDEALTVLNELLEICAKTRDAIHEVSTLNNLVYVWLPQSNYQQIRVDFEKALRLARENCFSSLESNLIHNLAEVSLVSGDLEAALRYAAQNTALSDRMSGVSPYPSLLMALLSARAKIAMGDEEGARAFLQEAQRRMDAAKGTPNELHYMPSDAVLFDAVDLATRDATDEEWDAVLARSKEFSVQLEPMEVWAIRAMAAARRKRPDVARQALDHALKLAEITPTPMQSQLQTWRDNLADA